MPSVLEPSVRGGSVVVVGDQACAGVLRVVALVLARALLVRLHRLQAGLLLVQYTGILTPETREKVRNTKSDII